MKCRESHLHALRPTDSDLPPRLYSHIPSHTANHLWLHAEWAPLLMLSRPRALLHSGSRAQRSTRLSRTLHVLTPALQSREPLESDTQLSIHCSLMQLERGLHEICMLPWDTTHKAERVGSLLECQGGLNLDIVMEKSFTLRSPLLLLLRLFLFLLWKRKVEHVWIDSSQPEFYLTQPTTLETTQSKCADNRYPQASELAPALCIIIWHNYLAFFLLCGSALQVMLSLQKHMCQIASRACLSPSAATHLLYPSSSLSTVPLAPDWSSVMIANWMLWPGQVHVYFCDPASSAVSH